MPSLSKVFSRNKESKEKEALREASSSSSSNEHNDPPPSYAPPAYTLDAEDVDFAPNMTAGFANLNLEPTSSATPTPSECIAHLKLLECFYRLRQTIGSSDGLFGIHNSTITALNGGQESNEPKLLTLLAEKRWAVYVARAVARFERWRDDVAPARQYMRNTDCLKDGRLEQQVQQDPKMRPLDLDVDTMPSVDVLMIWHSYMLNPRAYLEDCIREGRMALWYTPMPWATVAECINNATFNYTSMGADKAYIDSGDSEGLMIPCSKCNTALYNVSWTTVGQEKLPTGSNSAGKLESLVKDWVSSGNGYADQSFLVKCRKCQQVIDRDRLQVDKFMSDLQKLLEDDIALPGSVMGVEGLPGSVTVDGKKVNDITTSHGCEFPGQLFKSGLGRSIMSDGQIRSMNDVRKFIETGMRDKELMKIARDSNNVAAQRNERIAIRKMMSRYWDNGTPFALDLAGAVVRQGEFITKMHDIAWLYSPALPSTMRRALVKYERFFTILKDQSHMAVPTLEVDLAWHTHQLNPLSYFIHSVRNTRTFIDHDDKVAETTLHESFTWTSKTYEKLYKEPYSECTCWYCEAVRESHTSPTSRIFHSSKAPANDSPFHSTDPKKLVHISAHNSVAPTGSAVYTTVTAFKIRELEMHYAKACSRATKKGKPVPKREEYTYSDAYGYPVYMPAYAPYMLGAAYMTPGVYGVNPGCMAMATGAAGNCCSATCAASVAAGGCAGGGAGAFAAGAGMVGGAGGCMVGSSAMFGGAMGSTGMGAMGMGGVACGGGGGGCGGGGGGGC